MMSTFSRRIWLNKEDSASTGSAVAFSGICKWRNEPEETVTFLEISDCHCKIRLHKTYTDSNKDFIEKMRKLSQLVSDFADFIEKEYHEHEAANER